MQFFKKLILSVKLVPVIIVTVITVTLALIMHYTHVMAPIKAFTDITMEYNDSYEEQIEQYAVRFGEEKQFEYLLAPAPEDLDLKLTLNSDLLLFMLIVPSYDKHCLIHQEGKSKLVVSQFSDGLEDALLDLNQGHYFRVGSELGLRMIDPDNGRCGKVTITFEEQHRSRYFVIAFVAFWVSLALVLGLINSNPLYALSGVFSHVVFIYANRSIDAFASESFYYSLISCAGLLGLLLICISLPIWKWLKALLASSVFMVALILPVLFIGFYAIYSVGITDDSVHAVLQSNQRQAIEFWIDTVSTKINLILLALICLVLLAFYFSNKALFNKKTTAVFGLLVVFSVAVMQWKTFIDKTPVLSLTHTAVNNYFSELSTYKAISDERIEKLKQVGATNTRENQSLVVVIGETASKHHMSTYGYGRKTTPNMDELYEAGEILRFNSAYSNHVHSNPTISRALTQANNYNGLDWVGTPSIVNMANAAGIRTSWVSNKPMFGVWDNHMNVIGNESQSVTFINHRVGIAKVPNEFDTQLVPLVKDALTEEQNNELVMMHLQGSHRAYCHRSPEEFKVFTGPGERFVFGNFFDDHPYQVFINDSINCYDSAIYFTDHVLSQVYEHLNIRTKPTAMVYIPDHGESVLDNKAHNLHQFDFNMIEIPILFWANQAWKDQNPERWKNLQANIDKVFTNDLMFEFVSGLSGIQSSAVDPKNDLSSSVYEEQPIPKTLHGKVSINTADNWSYWQRENARYLQENKANQRMLISHVNTLTKAGNLLSDNMTGLQVDLVFDQTGSAPQLQVGSDADNMADISLQTFLERLDHTKLTSLWLDIKNLTSGDTESMLGLLDLLNNQYNLKQKAVLQVRENTPDLKQLSNAGYKLAYTADPSTLNSGDNGLASNLWQTANDIGANILSVPIEYYSALGSIQGTGSIHLYSPDDFTMSSPNLLELLKTKDYFNDERVLAISLEAKSRFDFEENRYE